MEPHPLEVTMKSVLTRKGRMDDAASPPRGPGEFRVGNSIAFTLSCDIFAFIGALRYLSRRSQPDEA